jgi:hypothetical protein
MLSDFLWDSLQILCCLSLCIIYSLCKITCGFLFTEVAEPLCFVKGVARGEGQALSQKCLHCLLKLHALCTSTLCPPTLLLIRLVCFLQSAAHKMPKVNNCPSVCLPCRVVLVGQSFGGLVAHTLAAKLLLQVS